MTELTYKGRRVPWVTKWTGEQLDNQSFQVALAGRRPYIRHVPPNPLDRTRDGTLWYRDGIAQGVGEPMWATVHTARHRLCMTKRRCQVCGVTQPQGRIPYLFASFEWDILREPSPGQDDAMTSVTPPTCPNCWDVAATMCPHLRKFEVIPAYVSSIEPWGVVGDLYAMDGSCQPRVRVQFGTLDTLAMTCAKQLIVRLHGLREAGGGRPRGQAPASDIRPDGNPLP